MASVDTVLDTLVPCDPYHPALCINISAEKTVPIPINSHNFFNFHQASYPDINKFLLSFNWYETFLSLDVNSATNAFYDALHSCILQFVPKVSFTPSKFPAWFTKDLKALAFDKKRAHAKYKSTCNQSDYISFSYIRARFKSESKKCYKAHLFRTESALKYNPRSFWDFVRKSKSQNGIPNLVHLNGSSCTGPEKISNLFASHFNSVYTSNTSNTFDMPFLQHDLPSNSSISIVDIEAGLDKLKNLKSVGPDGLSGIYLYNIRNSISFPLLLLFRRSLDEGVYPSIWKMSCVSPIHKSGDKSDVKNYRPISILSHLAKLFDSLVLQSIKPSVNSVLIDERLQTRPLHNNELYDL